MNELNTNPTRPQNHPTGQTIQVDYEQGEDRRKDLDAQMCEHPIVERCGLPRQINAAFNLKRHHDVFTLAMETGEAHNRIMHLCLQDLAHKLSTSITGPKLTKKRFMQMTEDCVEKAIYRDYFFNNNVTRARTIANSIFQKYSLFLEENRKSLVLPFFLGLLDEYKISETQRFFSKELLYSFEAQGPNNRRLYTTALSALEMLPADESYPIVVGAVIGMYSLEFRKNEVEEAIRPVWHLLGRDPASTADTGSVAGSDLGGGIAGAVGAVVTGCAELTLGACAALGGAAGAGAASIKKLVENIWGDDE